MLSVGNYLAAVQLLLVEFGKYFAVLLLSVLAYRICRSSLKLPVASRWKSVLVAGFIGVLAIATGYFSIRNSLAIMYFHYGEVAFQSGRLEQAYALYDTSGKYWNGADVTGRRGVCLMLMGVSDAGEDLLAQAATLRHGGNTGYENYHAGLYYLVTHQDKKAVPLLSAVSADPAYHWTVLKYFAALDLDAGDTADAAELMKPYINTDVTDGDQAYILASLKLADGKPDEARKLLGKFSAADLTPFWQGRFEKLSAQLKKP